MPSQTIALDGCFDSDTDIDPIIASSPMSSTTPHDDHKFDQADMILQDDTAFMDPSDQQQQQEAEEQNLLESYRYQLHHRSSRRQGSSGHQSFDQQ